MRRLTAWRGLPWLGILLLTLLFFHQLAFSGMILARGDTFQYFYPYWDARNAAFRAGELPLWASELFMGLPLLANPQLGVYYPLNWLTAPFRAPAAITLSVLLHVALAAAGACCLYRQLISRRWLPAMVAGIAFAFGGVFSAHIEQINQLQGLAWMPILFALYHRLLAGERAWRAGLLLAMAWALQIFSGHTQTVFISGVGLAIYGAGYGLAAAGPRRLARALLPLIPLALCFALALLLALPQLLPSLELMAMSNRGAGFSLQAATAFSLPPSMLGRALLPSYDGQVFGEYAATIGVAGLGLALWGMLNGGGNLLQRRLWITLAIVGMALALGRSNPLYLLLAELPGFNLFRVPARFLALFGLAMALLAGLGVEAMARPGRSWRLAVVALALGLLIGGTLWLLPGQEALIFGGAGISWLSLALWLGAGLALLALLLIKRPGMQMAAVALLTAELFVAARQLPHQDLAPADVYLGEREPISLLRQLQEGEIMPGRTLSASQIYFDPLDIIELRRRYAELGMDWQAQFHALDAIKMQETLYPNLALSWGLPSVDGFGGGITPSRGFSLYASLLLPRAAPLPVDGRLGERMAVPNCWGACLPARPWLEASDIRAIITDKVYDVWYEGVAYDTALSRYWTAAESLPALPDFADALSVLHRDELPGGLPAREYIYNGHRLLFTTVALDRLDVGLLHAEGILALTAINSQDASQFQELQPPPFTRVYAGAVKIFQLPPAGRRAFLAGDIVTVSDDALGDARALDLLREGAPLVIHGDMRHAKAELDGSQTVTVLGYAANEISLGIDTPDAAILALAEAWHPGWRATVNGQPTPVYRANLVYRALPVPPGESLVKLVFAPQGWREALFVGIALWGLALLAAAFDGIFRRFPQGHRQES